MNVSLTPKLEEYVKSKVDSGLYNSASEVLRESLRALREKEEAKTQKQELDALLKDRLAKLENGEETISLEQARDNILASIKKTV